MSFIEAVGSAFANYFNFKDRAGRAGYWWFVLFQFLVGIATYAIDSTIFNTTLEDFGPANSIATLVTLVPSIAVGTRRLHDIGRSGWWQLIALTVIGIVPLIYWACQPGDRDANTYGPPPK